MSGEFTKNPKEVSGSIYVEMIKELYNSADCVENELIYIFDYYLTQKDQEFLARTLMGYLDSNRR